MIIPALIVLFELIIHIIPLNGATGNELNAYELYPAIEVNLQHLQNITDEKNHTITFLYKRTEGSFLQPVTVEITCDLNDGEPYTVLSSDQINAYCNGLIFKQSGESVNIAGDTVFIQISGYRKTFCINGRPEQFGFAIKIAE